MVLSCTAENTNTNNDDVMYTAAHARRHSNTVKT